MNRSRNPFPWNTYTKPRIRGFSMLEVLVSIIIVSMGLLGFAGMSMRSLAANDSSGYRATAAYSALLIADLMRSNRQATYTGHYNVEIGAAAASTNVRAQHDITSWKKTLSKSLPSGDGSIVYDSSGPSARITVQWNDQRGNLSHTETTTMQDYAYTFRP